MARLKKPANLRAIDGGARHGETLKKPATTSVAAQQLARPSPWLDPVAKKFWRQILPKLDSLSVLHAVDRAALEMLCATYSQWVTARQAAGTEFAVQSAAGTAKKNPAHTIAATAQNHFFRCLDLFALSPAARVRLGVTGERNDKHDEFDKLINS